MSNRSCIKSSDGVIYGMGFMGALVFFWVNSTTFWMVLLGLLKAIFWPAILVYEFMEFLIR